MKFSFETVASAYCCYVSIGGFVFYGHPFFALMTVTWGVLLVLCCRRDIILRDRANGSLRVAA